MQTVKARARFVGYAGDPKWHVTHPATSETALTSLPRDGAARLLERHVVPHQCERLSNRSTGGV